MTSPLLSMNDVAAIYGDFQALFNITLDVNAGEIVTLIGSNGAGKTTTLRVISGLLRAQRGTVVLRWAGPLEAGGARNRRSRHQPRARRSQLFPHMSVEENLTLGGYMPHVRANIAAKKGRDVRNLPAP